MIFAIQLFIQCSFILTVSAAYLNNFGQHLEFTCPHPSQSIHTVISEHNNQNEDRRFDLSCADVFMSPATQPTCTWSDFVNDLGGILHYTCPTNHYISGMISDHDNTVKDRKWKFYCCSIKELHMSDCSYTGWTNRPDQKQNLVVPIGKVLKGALGYFNSAANDRIYQYEVCNVVQLTSDLIG